MLANDTKFDELLGHFSRHLAAQADAIEIEAEKLSEAMADARAAMGGNEWNMARMQRSIHRLDG